MGYNRKANGCRVLIDMFGLCGFKYWLITVTVILIALFTQLKTEMQIEPACLYKHIIDIVPNLLGFMMTGLTIIYGVQGIVHKRLEMKADDGQIPFHVISASFSLSIFSLFITLVLSVVFDVFIRHNSCCESLCLFVTIVFFIISVTSTINTIFHLFSMRTQISPIIKKKGVR